MKDHTLLAELWGDYIVNDNDTDGHKVLITSEMSLLSAVHAVPMVHARAFDVCAAQQTSIVTLWASLAIARLKGVNRTYTGKPHKERLWVNKVTDLFLSPKWGNRRSIKQTLTTELPLETWVCQCAHGCENWQKARVSR